MGVTPTFSLIVRIANPGSSEEIEIDLPPTTKGQDIIDTLIDNNFIEGVDINGQRTLHTIISKKAGKEIGMHQTIEEVGVNNGDTLIVRPVVEAGAEKVVYVC